MNLRKYILPVLIKGNRVRYFFWALYAQVLISLRVRRVRRLRRPIRVAFLTRGATSLWFERVFDMMRANERFEPQYVILPFVGHGDEAEVKARTRTYDDLVAIVGEHCVRQTWNGTSYDDIIGDFDICLTMNPYDNLTTKPYRISTIATRGIPVVYCRYFTDSGTRFTASRQNRQKEMFFLWRFYLDNQRVVAEVARHQPLLRVFNRLRAAGIPKTDKLAEAQVCVRARKRVILAPHHSVGENKLFWIGNFPSYREFYLALPKRYPQIDWVWRPHPLLYTRMMEVGLWSSEQRDAFHRQMTSFANVEYQDGGAYYDTFVNSDGLIQDCASFLAEYTYTGKPQCFILRNPQEKTEEFTEYGRDLLSHTYQAYSENDIISFIENVILKGDDPMRDDRERFAPTIKHNYPHASEAIFEELKHSLG